MATNDITGNTLITKPASEAYRNNYDAIFKGKQMDEADYGNERAAAMLEATLQEHQYALSHAVSAYPIGECRNCSTKLDDGRAFCDPECAKDFEYRQKMNKHRGKL